MLWTFSYYYYYKYIIHNQYLKASKKTDIKSGQRALIHIKKSDHHPSNRPSFVLFFSIHFRNNTWIQWFYQSLWECRYIWIVYSNIYIFMCITFYYIIWVKFLNPLNDIDDYMLGLLFYSLACWYNLSNLLFSLGKAFF